MSSPMGVPNDRNGNVSRSGLFAHTPWQSRAVLQCLPRLRNAGCDGRKCVPLGAVAVRRATGEKARLRQLLLGTHARNGTATCTHAQNHVHVEVDDPVQRRTQTFP